MHVTQVLAVAIGQQVVPARAQMATTLGFHIILACFGIAFPTVVLVGEFRALSRSDDVAMLLARRWSQVLGVLVAVGAVTGTVLSFEMGLLWPGLMRTYGAVLGVPFGFEGIFFFLEAIFTGIYLYGWQRLPCWAHFWTGTPIAITGLGGAVAVMAANSWMNSPGGFTLSHGKVVAVDAWQVFFNRASLYETPHMILAAYMVTGFLVASVYAAGMLKGRRDRYHRLGFGIPFTIGAILTPVQLFVGDTAARALAAAAPDFRGHRGRAGRRQPAAGQVRRDGVRHPDQPRRARVPGRLLRQREGLLRAAPAGRGLPAGRVQPAHQGHRAGLGGCRRPAAGPVAAPSVIRRHGRAGLPPAAGRIVGAAGLVPPPRPAPGAGVLVARGDLRPGGPGGGGGGLGW